MVTYSDDEKPVAIWPALCAAGQDSYDLAVLQPIVERNELVVDLGANALMADFGVDAVGKVDWRCPGRQLDDVPGRREDVDLLLEDVGLHRLDELFGIGDLVTPLHELPEPGHFRFDASVGAAAFFVAPMGRDAMFRRAVHLQLRI